MGIKLRSVFPVTFYSLFFQPCDKWKIFQLKRKVRQRMCRTRNEFRCDGMEMSTRHVDTMMNVISLRK